MDPILGSSLFRNSSGSALMTVSPAYFGRDVSLCQGLTDFLLLRHLLSCSSQGSHLGLCPRCPHCPECPSLLHSLRDPSSLTDQLNRHSLAPPPVFLFTFMVGLKRERHCSQHWH